MQIIVIWKLLIDFRVCSPWNLINIRNGKYRKFVLCLYKGIGADSWKPHRDNYFLTLANGNLFLLRHVEISSVLLFSKVSGSAQMMDFLGGNHRLHCLNHIGILRPFCGFSVIDCYQDHGLLKFHTCFDDPASFMLSRCLKDFVWLLYRVLSETYTVERNSEGKYASSSVRLLPLETYTLSPKLSPWLIQISSNPNIRHI